MMLTRLSLLSLLTLTTALQTIYVGTDTTATSPLQGTYIAWFSDSNACNDGVKFGDLSRGFNNCNQPLTILGHTNITFTGCNTGIHASSYPTLPTGINDNGTPALKCVAAKNPPSAPADKDKQFQICSGGTNSGNVSVVEYCS